MGVRITQSQITSRTLRDLNAQMRSLSTLQETLATGKRVNSPSDDPIDARRAISIRRSISKSEQFLSNLNDLQPQLNGAEGVLTSILNILQRTQELTIRGINGSLSTEQMQQSAVEVNQLLEQALLEANTTINGRSLFAGTHTLSDAFSVTRDLLTDEITAANYEGNGVAIDVQFSDTGTLSVNSTGDDAFVSGVDLFALLIGIRDDMVAGDKDSLRTNHLDGLKDAQDQILESLAKIGGVQNRVEDISNTTEDFILALQEQLSDRVDADYAETVLNFNVQQNSFQSALNAAARIVQNSLLDFIR
jgi:flagellar hook-associated protein 3 FlgL